MPGHNSIIWWAYAPSAAPALHLSGKDLYWGVWFYAELGVTLPQLLNLLMMFMSAVPA